MGEHPPGLKPRTRLISEQLHSNWVEFRGVTAVAFAEKLPKIDGYQEHVALVHNYTDTCCLCLKFLHIAKRLFLKQSARQFVHKRLGSCTVILPLTEKQG